nr:alpha/beta hydrolase [Acidobacteriota bacterium]
KCTCLHAACVFTRMRRAFATLFLLLALTARGEEGWQPFVLRSYDGRESRAESRMVAVRENRHEATSRFIRIGVVRLPATRTIAGASPIVFLSGGPGIPATVLARVPVYYDLFERLRAIGDVLLIDQRGSGMSVPNLTCPRAEIPSDALASDERMRQMLIARVGQCAEFWRSGGLDLRGYSTGEIAEDVDVIRRVAGARKVNLLAFSYGSEVAFEILRRRLESVQRVVFASTRAPDTLLKSPLAWDQQLEKIGALANVPLRENVASAVGRLDANPITTTGERPLVLSGIALLTLLRADLPEGRSIGKIPGLVEAVKNGDASVLAQRARQTLDSIAGSFNLMTLAVDCSSGWSEERLSRTRREAAGAVMRNVNLQWDPEVCAALGGSGVPPSIPDIRVPALFITGTLDPNAPIEQTDAIRRHFTKSVHIVVVHGAHETLPAADVQKRIVSFFGGEPVTDAPIVLPSPFEH